VSEGVWVVSADRVIQQALTLLLREASIPTRALSDVRGAAQEALRDPPRVLVTELSLPSVDGIALARELREGLGAACPRLVLLASSEVRRVDFTLFDHVARKPFRLDALVPTLRGYLSRPVRRASSHQRLRSGGAPAAGEGGQSR
jgi:DNA-binding response OmpR family regulator